jgi:hypothetical protein
VFTGAFTSAAKSDAPSPPNRVETVPVPSRFPTRIPKPDVQLVQ